MYLGGGLFVVIGDAFAPAEEIEDEGGDHALDGGEKNNGEGAFPSDECADESEEFDIAESETGAAEDDLIKEMDSEQSASTEGSAKDGILPRG